MVWSFSLGKKSEEKKIHFSDRRKKNWKTNSEAYDYSATESFLVYHTFMDDADHSANESFTLFFPTVLFLVEVS